MKKKRQLIAGDTINDLTVIKLDHKDHRHRRFLLCKCICGEIKVIQGSLITSGNTKSCGCRIKKAAAARKLPDNGGVINQIIAGYKRHAKDRGLEWDLSVKDVRYIISSNCHYCGSPPGNIKITKNCLGGFNYSGIDRYNNKKGYVPGNCQPCCKVCNYAKSNMTYEDFEMWIIRTYQHLQAITDQWG